MILATVDATTLIKYMRLFFGAIDQVIYWLLVKVYNLFIAISEFEFLDTDLATFANRVYALIGIIMLFKLSFSIVGYIVDPDKLVDAKAGFGSIIKNTIVMLTLIITVPIIFKYARELQRYILKDDTIPRVILGKTNGNNFGDYGETLAADVLTTFIYPNQEKYPGCDSSTIMDANGPCKKMAEGNQNEQDLYTEYKAIHDCMAEGGGKCTHSIYIQLKDGKFEVVANPSSSDNAAPLATVTTTPYKSLLTLGSGTDWGSRTHKWFESDEYYMDYQFGLSTATGAFVAYILLLFCIDIAVRAVKLGFLQLIAPIPIVMYVDPSGRKKFDEWVKLCISTYLDLFVRLAAIFFALQMILFAKNAIGNYDKGHLAKLFVILGCLMFAKQLPKLIEQLTGIKLDGGFTLNPMKKLGEVPLVGKPMASGLAFAGRTAGNLTAGLAGGVWAHTGAVAADKLKKSYEGSSLAKGAGAVSGVLSNFYDSADSFMGNRLSKIGADASGTFGARFTQASDDRKLANMKRVTDTITNIENRAKEKIKNGEAGKLSEEYMSRQAEIDMLKNGTAAERADAFDRFRTDYYRENGKDFDGEFEDMLATKQMSLNNWFNNDATYAFEELNAGATSYKTEDGRTYNASDVFGQNSDGSLKTDATLTTMQKDYKQAVAAGGYDEKTTGSDLHGQLGKFKGATADINRKRYAQQQAVDSKKPKK